MHYVPTLALLFGVAISRPLGLSIGPRPSTRNGHSLIDFPAPGRDNNGQGSTEETNGKFVFDSGCFAKTIHSDVQPLGTGKGFGGPINVEGFSAPIDFFAQTIGGPASGFASGYCGMHVTQIFIGDSVGPKDAPANVGIDVTSKLPFVMIVTAQNVDDDPIKFAYAGQNFDSNAAQCSVGGYDSGKREMDCGFTC
ncbi:hypothetical protein DL96DRAFT_1684436 [Flagelloscypha sp. PMI_526]|nr:hypothetical protein DL96DRAFT_1684436 [Flagelloscypha sp. PMI_526]